VSYSVIGVVGEGEMGFPSEVGLCLKINPIIEGVYSPAFTFGVSTERYSGGTEEDLGVYGMVGKSVSGVVPVEVMGGGGYSLSAEMWEVFCGMDVVLFDQVALLMDYRYLPDGSDGVFNIGGRVMFYGRLGIELGVRDLLAVPSRIVKITYLEVF